MRRISATLVALLLLVLGTVPASATRSQPDHPVPIGGALLGVDDVDEAAPGCPTDTNWQWRYYSSGSGTLSHLGIVDYNFTHCTLADAAGIEHGMLTATSANGDLLVLSYSGGNIQYAPDGSWATWEITWSVQSGTGRFAGAQGSGTGQALTTIPLPDPVTTELTLNGTVAYNASNRSK